MPHTSRLDDHVAALFELIRPAADAIRRFAASGENQVMLQLVRYFEPGPEDDEILASRLRGSPPEVEILRGQHPLLGFRLDANQVAWLGSLGIGLDLDEYGDEYE